MTNQPKSSVEEIRARFDQHVERFSNLETGQAAAMDGRLLLELVTSVAATHAPEAQAVLDIGCGAGNFTLKLLQQVPRLACTLIDLSQPMLAKAQERLAESTAADVVALQGDVRDVSLPEGAFDIIMAASVLHHLRDDADWESTFAKIHRAMRPGGIFVVSDLVAHDLPAVAKVQTERYGQFLEDQQGAEYRQAVFAYIEEEDTPRSVLYQIDLCRRTGFRQTELLHLNACFGAYCAVK